MTEINENKVEETKVGQEEVLERVESPFDNPLDLSKAFQHYVAESDYLVGKVLPLEQKGDTLRMRLDDKQLFIKSVGQHLSFYYLQKDYEIISRELGTCSSKKELERMKNLIIDETVDKYTYSLETLFTGLAKIIE